MIYVQTKARLSIILALILLIAFSAINMLNFDVSRTALRKCIKDNSLPGISNDIYHEFQKDLITPIKISSLMANDTFLKDWILEGEKDISKITKYLWEIKERYNFFSTFLISSKTKKYYHYTGILKTITPKDKHDRWYYDFVDSGQDYVVDVDTNEAANNELSIFINHRVNNYQGDLIGVTGVGLKMNKIGKLLHSYEKRYHKNIYLVNKKGVIQIHSNQNLIGKINILNKEGISNIAKDILSNTVSSTIREYDASNKHVILISRYIPEFERFLIVEHQEGKEIKRLQETFVYNLIIGFSVTILVIIIILLIVNHYQSKLEVLATTDELTELPNRHYFFSQAQRDLANATRSGSSISLLMIDIDHFKQVNDNFGHEIGDRVLKESAQIFLQNLRKGDLAGRVGGEEFAILLPQTKTNEAFEVAERLRSSVENNIINLATRNCKVTISIGLATDPIPEGNLESLMQQADKSLYKAKELGRNRVWYKNS